MAALLQAGQTLAYLEYVSALPGFCALPSRFLTPRLKGNANY